MNCTYVRRSLTLNFLDGKHGNSRDRHFKVDKENISHKNNKDILIYYSFIFALITTKSNNIFECLIRFFYNTFAVCDIIIVNVVRE